MASLPPTPVEEPTDEKPLPKAPFLFLLRQVFAPRDLLILGVLLLELLVFSVADRTLRAGQPPFVTAESLLLSARYVSIIGIAAVGISLVILTRGIDLSVGAVYGLCGAVFVALMVRPGAPVAAPLAALVALAIGLGIGVLNGALIAYLRVPAFIVTLGVLGIARGVSFLVTNGEQLPSATRTLPDASAAWLRALDVRFFQNTGLPLALSFLVMLALALLVAFLLVATPWGRHVVAVGGNEEAARFAGVRVERTLLSVYAVTGVCAALSGIFYVARYKGINAAVGPGEELAIIAACVVGGVSLAGGKGSPLGAVIGALIVKVLNDGLVFYQVPQAGAQIAVGAFIVVAALIDLALKRLRLPALPFPRRPAAPPTPNTENPA
jgi:ribose transport system permease protein